jgi:hypothetical protein
VSSALTFLDSGFRRNDEVNYVANHEPPWGQRTPSAQNKMTHPLLVFSVLSVFSVVNEVQD